MRYLFFGPSSITIHFAYREDFQEALLLFVQVS